MKGKRVLFVISAAFIVFSVLALSPTRHAQGFKKMTMAVAHVQEGAPAQLDSVSHGVDFLFSRAEVKNVSDRTVRSITFGVLLHETPPNHSEPILVSSREIQTDIKAGATRSLDVLDLPLKDGQQKASQLKSNQVILEFGILSVQFDDGSMWTTDPLKSGAFSTVTVSSLADRSTKLNCKPTKSSILAAALDKIVPSLSVVLAQGYTC